MTFLLQNYHSPSNSACPPKWLIQEPFGSVPPLVAAAPESGGPRGPFGAVEMETPEIPEGRNAASSSQAPASQLTACSAQSSCGLGDGTSVATGDTGTGIKCHEDTGPAAREAANLCAPPMGDGHPIPDRRSGQHPAARLTA